MAESVDATDLKSVAARREGSSPSLGSVLIEQLDQLHYSVGLTLKITNGE